MGQIVDDEGHQEQSQTSHRQELQGRLPEDQREK